MGYDICQVCSQPTFRCECKPRNDFVRWLRNTFHVRDGKLLIETILNRQVMTREQADELIDHLRSCAGFCPTLDERLGLPSGGGDYTVLAHEAEMADSEAARLRAALEVIAARRTTADRISLEIADTALSGGDVRDLAVKEWVKK